MSDEADIMNWLDQTCPEGHTIGVDGVHTVLSDLKVYGELSLVTTGAAKNPKIQSKRQAKLLTDNFSVAANGKSVNISFKENPIFLTLQGSSIMDPNENKEDKASEEDKVVTAEAEEEASDKAEDETKADELAAEDKAEEDKASEEKSETSEVAASNQEVTLSMSFDKVIELSVNNKVLSNEVVQLKTEISNLKSKAETSEKEKSDLALCLDFLKKSYTHLAVASGVSKPEAPSSVETLLSEISGFQQKLSKLPTGGISLSADAFTVKKDSKEVKNELSSFKTKSNNNKS
jgi:hypothetical protein